MPNTKYKVLHVYVLAEDYDEIQKSLDAHGAVKVTQSIIRESVLRSLDTVMLNAPTEAVSA